MAALVVLTKNALDAVNDALDGIDPALKEWGEVPDEAILALIHAQGNLHAAIEALPPGTA